MSDWCVGNIATSRYCCVINCTTCGGSGCGSRAPGFTCCTGGMTDACLTPEQHTRHTQGYAPP